MSAAAALPRKGTTGIAVCAAIAAAVLLASGCTSSGSGGGSCEDRVKFEHRMYTGLANVDFTTGERLGTGRIPQCNDTGGSGKRSEPPEPLQTIFAVKGLDPSVAVAAGESRDDAGFYSLKRSKPAGDGEKLPDAVRKYLRSHH
ncbi:DUF6281 family protein [Spelaeicoccus albus]|uniref:Lipoprotein n=1 Tax=Spelaeicoccus albus TaxID=1280376 RepID=A0A7Z0AC35_9MICO|nr:DUF6281 family protein [Spelaeicoccus albus]NYI66411.1 hypothetical protein [Spelaeicoccus albus]